jgi:type II secretory pathway pseudopilin PulG
MTQKPLDSISPTPPKQGGMSALAWIIAGCGCLGLGALAFLILMLFTVAMPSFLQQVNKSKEKMAQTNLQNINWSQQRLQLKKGIFSKSIQNLDVKISDTFFTYQVVPSANPHVAIATATPTQSELKSYTAAVFKIGSSPTQPKFVSGICETDPASPNPPELSVIPNSITESVECPLGSSLAK